VNDVLLRALAGEPTPYTPVWFMRQAGRYQAEYRRLRERYTLPEIVREPELAARVTLLPVQNLGVDAAILFADLTTPLPGMGVAVELVEGKGPVIGQPIRSRDDLGRLRPLEPERDVPFVLEAIRLLKKELDVPLIAFAGAPFTLASYLVEGGASRRYLEVKRFLYHDPEGFARLLERLAEGMAAYLKAQAAAGADVLMVFDSWVGQLTRRDYRRHALPATRRLFAELEATGRPTLYFGTGAMHLLELMHQAGPRALGIDAATPLAWARERLGATPVQGNLDPAYLFAPKPRLLAEVDAILEENMGRPGHVFNLGHGILPGTPEAQVRAVVERVHERTGA